MEIISNNKHNTNFCGYKNVIATEIRSNNNKVSCLSVQLNDTGYNDLSKWQEIQKKLKPYSPVSDLLLLSHIDTGEHCAYILNGYNISVSPNLCSIISREEEEWVFKFYTFLASLTKRIQDAPFFLKNNAFLGKVAGYSMQQLINLGFEKNNAIDIITYGLISSEKDIRRIAKSIGDDIHQSMVEYIG